MDNSFCTQKERERINIIYLDEKYTCFVLFCITECQQGTEHFGLPSIIPSIQDT